MRYLEILLSSRYYAVRFKPLEFILQGVPSSLHPKTNVGFIGGSRFLSERISEKVQQIVEFGIY